MSKVCKEKFFTVYGRVYIRGGGGILIFFNPADTQYI